MNPTNLEAVERLRKFVLTRRHRLQARQKDISDRSGVSIGWIGLLEAGKLQTPPRTDTLNKLVRGLTLVGETPGTLYNFLELVLAGSLDTKVIQEVADGTTDALTAMAKAVEGVGVSELPTNTQDASLLLNQGLREKRLDRVLSLLKVDLGARDFGLAQIFLQRLYDIDHVSQPQLSPKSPPRKRKSREVSSS